MPMYQVLSMVAPSLSWTLTRSPAAVPTILAASIVTLARRPPAGIVKVLVMTVVSVLNGTVEVITAGVLSVIAPGAIFAAPTCMNVRRSVMSLFVICVTPVLTAMRARMMYGLLAPMAVVI